MSTPIVKHNSTHARVSFFTFKPPPFDRVDAYDELSIPLPTGLQEVKTSLVSFQYTKRLGEAAGRVVIQLKGSKIAGNPLLRGRAWPDLIEEGDWWSIDVIKNGVTVGVSFGRIDRVGVSIQANRGEGNIGVTVEGRDFGFALEDTPVYFNEYDSTQDNAVGSLMAEIIGTAKGLPGLVITNMIRGFMGLSNINVQLLGGHTRVPARLGGPFGSPTPADPRGAFWGDFLDLTSCVQPTLKGFIATPTLFGQRGNGSLWNLIQTWKNPVLNELYVDIVPTPGVPKRACLVFRERPFVSRGPGSLPGGSWQSLRTWSVDTAELRGLTVNRGGNRINHVQLLGDYVAGLSQDSYAISQPVADFLDISQQGLRRMQERTRYYDVVKDAGAGIELANLWLPLLVDWNVLNHRYWTGRMDLAEMRPEIRIGQKISMINGPPVGYSAFPNDSVLRPIRNVPNPAADLLSMTFYVEGVQHTFQEGDGKPMARSSFMVSRGYVEGERAAAVTERAAKFTLVSSTSSNIPTILDPTTPLEARLIDTGPTPSTWRTLTTALV